MAIERETEENADERRELAMAAAKSLRPNFKSKSGITATQVSKFRELHNRRLRIKAKFKENKRGKGKSHRKRSEAKECSGEEEPSNAVGESSTAPILRDTPSVEEDNVAGNLVANKRRKLHWGLDTKERWEQKSNM
ncbi:uncharacterized protein [Primulina huaijiensis]|uniref:uncharacterized protein n=1 Tax=Primulina huaijiensis TaxID=1492673 RepID=UPI003CC7252F